MIKIIKNVEVFSPQPLGKRDVLIAHDKIVAIDKDIALNGSYVESIDGSGKLCVPGFIDSHVHIIGGGGEGGFTTRTPELLFSDLVQGGITTVVGCLGTDGVTRNLNSLYAKAKSLDEQGVTCYIYSGSYRVPIVTFTGSLLQDLILIDKVIGAGEIAISDHRSSQPTVEELKRIAADARVGGILSNKAGIVNLHVGDGPSMLDMLYEIIQTTEIPTSQFLPTHINRNRKLLQEGLNYVQMGGVVDFTTSVGSLLEEDLQAWKALRDYVDHGFEDSVTFSSDGQGSLPRFNDKKEFVGLDVGRVTSVYEQFRLAVENGVELQKALKAVTKNPARVLKLTSKGCLDEGKDADLLLLDKDLCINTVIAKGKILMKEGQLIIKGTFE
ncbi:MAG TPA: beta-aspartyl-peptidase [Pseudothermotoga sp.]|nr:beta-aspartyl-peptidase [Pseudothermotoga sp.]HOK83931.1 beta-aspartyl-peptidase [Pseudothermotoga sp.]HPP70683.1 beta-aspartyl-peptidase [Pseudothermotoga sp.]